MDSASMDAFKAWAEDCGYDLNPSTRNNKQWQFDCSVTQELWWCWQAAVTWQEDNVP